MVLQLPLAYYPVSPSETALATFFEGLEHEDEAHILSASEAGVFEAVVPEWARMRGPLNTQHRTHDFTLDVHSAKVVAKTRQAKGFSELSPHWQRLVTLAAFFHDIQKEGGPAEARETLAPDALHPLKAGATIRQYLPSWGFSAIDTFVVAELVRYHQLFGRLIIRHKSLGHAPSKVTFLANAALFPDVRFFRALAPLTEGDIRSVKANDAIFTPEVDALLQHYIQETLASVPHHQKQFPPPHNSQVDAATGLHYLVVELDSQPLYPASKACACAWEGASSSTPFRARCSTFPDAANALALRCFSANNPHPLWPLQVKNPMTIYDRPK